MMPIQHPNIKDVKVQSILHALCDPIRLQIFMEISKSECSQICSNFLKVKNKKLAKSTLCNHFKILRQAGLIRSEKKGLELHNVTRCSELKEKFGPLIKNIIEAYQNQEISKNK
jgi:DNA-binding transcriptional ArsR family regulator